MSEKAGTFAACWRTVQPERFTSPSPALYSSMKPSVTLNSLIFTASVERTLRRARSRAAAPSQDATASRSPLKDAEPAWTSNSATTVWPGATA